MTTEAQRQGLGEYVRMGFTLQHDGSMAVFLLHEGELVGRFYQIGVTGESLQAECARHLALCHHWDGCLWSKKK